MKTTILVKDQPLPPALEARFREGPIKPVTMEDVLAELQKQTKLLERIAALLSRGTGVAS